MLDFFLNKNIQKKSRYLIWLDVFFTEKADVGFAEIYDGECPDDKTKLMHICYCDTDGCNAKDNDDIFG